jgi:hypothetical protein
MTDNRRFTRIVFSTPVMLTCKQEQWKTELIDVSFKGALVKKPDIFPSNETQPFTLSFRLANTEIDINMQVHRVHERDNCIGFTCDSIDIDSASHLRRLIELNVGNAELLNRDLEQLTIPEAS